VALLCAAALLLQACEFARFIDEKTKADFGTIGLVSASFIPEIELPEPAATPESGAVAGAAGGTLVGLGVMIAALSSCLFAPPACGGYLLGGAAVGGGVGAAVGSADETKAGAAREALGPVIEKQLVQDALRARVMAYATQHGVGPLIVIDDPRPSTPEGNPDYRQLSGRGIDTVLEVRLRELKLEKVSVFSDEYRPRAVAQARVIRVRDHAVLKDRAYALVGEEAVIDNWGGDNGRRFQAWVKYAYATLAEYILDEMILVYRPVSDVFVSKSERLGGLTGFGLHPEYPELRWDQVEVACLSCEEIARTASSRAFTEIDTLRPEFRWQPLVGVKQSADDKAPKKIQDVKYEIRLFTAQRRKFFVNLMTDYVRIGPELVSGPIYSRSGLVNPRHRIEQSLAPCTKYFWTVRAGFRVDGQTRVTEWTNLHGVPWILRVDPGVRGVCRARGLWALPDCFPTDYYLPFQTYCPANAGTKQRP